MADFRIERVSQYAPGMQVPPPVGPNDPRIPPPAPDTFNLELGLRTVERPTLIQSQAVSNKREDDEIMVKASIYSAKGEWFVLAIEDMEGEPIESFKFEAPLLAEKIKPMLEAVGVKCADRTGGDLRDALNALAGTKVTPMRRKRGATA